jgi:hypothetical protein
MYHFWELPSTTEISSFLQKWRRYVCARGRIIVLTFGRLETQVLELLLWRISTAFEWSVQIHLPLPLVFCREEGRIETV